jgi:hypothetical protein
MLKSRYWMTAETKGYGCYMGEIKVSLSSSCGGGFLTVFYCFLLQEYPPPHPTSTYLVDYQLSITYCI